MKKLVYILLFALAFASCVRDKIEPCPPLIVEITVKDKNYFNVDESPLEERLSEDLAFREYVPTLYYLLVNIETDEIVEKQDIFEVEGDGKTFIVTFCDCLPHGEYVFTVWGGLKGMTPLQGDEDDLDTTILFHRDGVEGSDVYMTSDTMIYDFNNNKYTSDLERAKGKVIIQLMNLPEHLDSLEKTVTGLVQNMNSAFQYSNSAMVNSQATWESDTDIVKSTALTPSLEKDGSVLSIDLYDAKDPILPPEEANINMGGGLLPKQDPQEPEEPVMSTDDVNITVSRNTLTVLRYVYTGNGKFDTYVWIDGNWEEIHSLIVEEK